MEWTDLLATELMHDWQANPRWGGIRRLYSAEDVLRLRGTIRIEHTLARMGALRLWELLSGPEPVLALGAMSGNQALQQVEAGLQAVYVSGWQVAADANLSGQMYPDQSLYPCNSVPELVRRINNAFVRADQIQHSEGMGARRHWFAPIVADAEAGFGGNLNAYELTRAMIEAGASAIHLEDQLATAKKCGHMGGKVLIPTAEFVQRLTSARLAADVSGVPTLVIARTDAAGAELLTSDVDPRDRPFLVGTRTIEGYHRVRGGIEAAIARAQAYAPHADALWFETSEPDLGEARRFAEAVLASHPRKFLAYNCSPSFNWKRKLDSGTIAVFNRELHAMGYRFQFVTLAGFHSLNYGMFNLSREFREKGMAAYAEFQAEELRAERQGYRAGAHQRFVGTGYFDEVAQRIAGGAFSTAALAGSTEERQFAGIGVGGPAAEAIDGEAEASAS